MNEAIFHYIEAIENIESAKINYEAALNTLDEAYEYEVYMLGKKISEEEVLDSYGDSPSDYAFMEDMSDVLDDYQSAEEDTKFKESFVEEFREELEEAEKNLIHKMAEFHNELAKSKSQYPEFEFENVELSFVKDHTDDEGKKCKIFLLKLRPQKDEYGYVNTTAIVYPELYHALSEKNFMGNVKGHLERETITFSCPLSVDLNLVIDEITLSVSEKATAFVKNLEKSEMADQMEDTEDNIPF